MAKFEKIFSLNKFPINKSEFFTFLYDLLEDNSEICTLFTLDPRVYSKIYVSLCDKDLQIIGDKHGDKDLINFFEKCDAAFSFEYHYIVIHVPSMVERLSVISTREDDPFRRILFTIHFFACLFHELAHANHATRFVVNNAFVLLDTGSKPKSYTVEESEKYAEDKEDISLKAIEKYLQKNNVSWIELSEKIFKWDKLQKHVFDTADKNPA